MFKGLVALFVKNSNDVENEKVRAAYGKLTGITGIILNVLLCALKIGAGILTGAISIISDGINNLSDAGSSVITLIGFKLSSKKPDKKHPFGHGRMEYFAGLAVSVIILIVAFELLTDSINKIIANSAPTFASNAVLIATVVILGSSILVKLWMALFNRYCGKKINSVAMTATSLDSITDCISTAVVLGCTVLGLFVKGVPIDGIAGVLVSLFIGYTGVKSVWEIVELLLGQAPDPEFVEEIANFVSNYDERIVGIHDLIVHDYGPGRKMITVHVEVPASGDIMALHDMVDNVEQGLEQQFGCMATIHMDPVDTDSARVAELKAKCIEIVKGIDPEFTIHDFRMNEGDTHANLIFDVVVNDKNKLSEAEITQKINHELKKEDEKLGAVVKVERSFV